MFSNSATSVEASERVDRELEGAVRLAGGWLIAPAATWTLAARSASTTSPAVRLREATLAGSSQMRIEKSRAPKTWTSPTPSTRVSTSFT